MDDEREAAEADGVGGAQRSADAAQVGRLVEVLERADRCYAEAAALLAGLDASGIVEREAGVSVEVLLAAEAGLVGTDRSVLLSAVAVLEDLPLVAAAWQQGALTWGQVRAITRAARRRSKADRAVIDRRVAAWLAAPRGSDDPDQLVWAVEACAEQLRAARQRVKSEQRRLARSFLSVQPDLDGGARVYGELAALDAASLLAALDAAAPAPAGDNQRRDTDNTGDTDAGGDPGAVGEPGGAAGADAPQEWSTTRRSRDYAAALTKVTSEWLTHGHDPADHHHRASHHHRACHHHSEGACEGAGDGAGDREAAGAGSPRGLKRAPRTAVTCHIDLSAATVQPDGTLALGLRGDLPRVTAAAVDALAADGAMLKVVLAHGRQPLGVSRAKRIPAAVRTAVASRDQGCRAPGCAAPAAWTDLHHHRVPQAIAADHRPAGLTAFCRRHHRMIEHHGWQLTLHPATGQVTFTRDDRAWTTLPNGTGLPNPPPTPPPPDPHAPF